MDWFERLTGFKVEGYDQTQSLLEVDGENLRSTVNGKSYRVGRLTRPSLRELRDQLALGPGQGQLEFDEIIDDVRSLHRSGENSGAFFQVASQFNLLEMVGPDVCPEDGVTGYQWDRTQGPACAISAGAATIYRNYFAPVGHQVGQTSALQVDCLADVRSQLAMHLNVSPEELWTMENGYPIATRDSLQAISDWIMQASIEEVDTLRSRLRIGVHNDVEVTDEPEIPRSVVSQAFCSALPVSYSRVAVALWEPFGRLVLEASYEATLSAAALHAARAGKNTVYLTRLGGGAFGNPPDWIDAALRRALQKFADCPLRVFLVRYGGGRA